MLETVAFDAGEVQYGSVVYTSHCGRPPAFQQVADLTENTTRFDLTQVIFPACKICTCHSTLPFRQEKQCSGRSSLADHYILRELLQWLAHGSDELELTLQNWISFQRL